MLEGGGHPVAYRMAEAVPGRFVAPLRDGSPNQSGDSARVAGTQFK
jgi:hypothetical protein